MRLKACHGPTPKSWLIIPETEVGEQFNEFEEEEPMDSGFREEDDSEEQGNQLPHVMTKIHVQPAGSDPPLQEEQGEEESGRRRPSQRNRRLPGHLHGFHL